MLRRPVGRGKASSPQLCRKLHIFSHHPGTDAAPVRLGDAPGDGQPDAKPSGGGIAGGVGAVKAVEQPCKGLCRDGVAAVAAPQHRTPQDTAPT